MDEDRHDAFEDLGYGPVPTAPRPTFDPGEFDHLQTFGERMSTRQGLATARRLLRQQEHNARVISTHGPHPDRQPSEDDEAGVRRLSA